MVPYSSRRKFSLCFFVAIIAIILSSSNSFAENYYVDARNGDDTSIPTNRLPLDGWKEIRWVDPYPGGWATIDVTTKGIFPDGEDVSMKLYDLILSSDKPRILYFPAGTYTFASQVVIRRSDIIIKGDGPAKTTFNFTGAGGGAFVAWRSDRLIKKILEDVPSGASTVIVDNTEGLVVGDLAYVVEDLDYYDNMEDPEGSHWGKRARGVTALITAINGNQVTVDTPLAIGLDNVDSKNAELRRIIGIRNIGFENFKLSRAPIQKGGSNFTFIGVYNGYIKNIESDNTQKHHVALSMCHNFVISGSYFHDAVSHGTGGYGYGVLAEYLCTNILVTNNIFKDLRHEHGVQAGPSYVIFSYNYNVDTFQDDCFKENPPEYCYYSGSKLHSMDIYYEVDICIHGHYPHNNLWEGNVAYYGAADSAHKDNGPHNTIFRNKFKGQPDKISWQRGVGFLVSNPSHSQNIIGNDFLNDSFIRIGTEVNDMFIAANAVKGVSVSNPHDSVGSIDKWDDLPAGAELPASLYLTEKPSFWPANLTWPPFGPDVPNSENNKIPAQLRYEAMTRKDAHYVDNQATGDNDGTSWANAWESFSDINWNLIQPGDVIYISGGSSSKRYTETLSIDKLANGGTSGTSENPIFICPGIDSGHNGRVIIDGEYTRDHSIFINNYDYITIRNFELKGSIGKGEVYIRGTTGVIIEDCDIKLERTHGGVNLNGWGGPNKNCIIRNNRITTPKGSFNYQTDGIYSQLNENNIYEGNYIVISNEHMNPHCDGIQLYKDTDIMMRGNYIEQDNDKPYNAQGIYATECSGTITAYNNIIYGPNTDNALLTLGRFAEGDARLIAYHNTLVGGRFGTIHMIDVPDSIVKNNIFVAYKENSPAFWLEGPISSPDNIDFNLYYTPNSPHEVYGKTWTQWKTLGFEAHGLNQDPKLNADFTLQSDSPAIDAGTDVGITRDFDGNPVPQGQAPDIGAYEYEGIAPPPANEPSIANIQATPLQGDAPLEVTLDGSSSTDPDGDIASYSWNLGDGTTSTSESLTHTYQDIGTYTVTLTIEDDDGEIATASVQIESTAPVVTPPNTYYIDAANGDDNNPGTESLPFATIQQAADTVHSGDTVYVKAGNYDERVNIRNSGTEGSPIIYKAQGTVVMKGFDIQADYIIVDGFEITNTDSDGVFVKGHYNQILNNYIHHLIYGGVNRDNCGIELSGRWPEWGDIYTENSNNLVKGNRIEYAYLAGIQVFGTDNIIEDNDISHTLTDGDADGLRFFGKGHIIKGNYIHDIIKAEAGGDPHIDCFQTWRNAEDIIFENNFCYLPDNSMQGVMIEQIYAPVRNLTFINNVFKMDADWYGPGIDIVAKTGQEMIENIKIYNNTFIHTGKNGDQNGQLSIIVRRVNGAYIKNNIIYEGTRPGIYTADCTNLEKDYNLFYAADGDIRDIKEPHDIWLDPLFVDFSNDDFHLQNISPAIDAGVDVGLPFEGDAPDIGAYEYEEENTKNIYYVATDGDDSNPGTEVNPFRTIWHAAKIVEPGDSVYVKEGDHSDQGTWDNRTYITTSGTADHPIEFRALGEVVTRGFNITADYIHLIGFEMVRNGVSIDGGHYCKIIDNFIHDTGYAGIDLLTTPRYEDNSTSTNCIVKGNTITYAVKCGIRLMGQNHLIEDNEISHTLMKSPYSDYRDDADGIRFFGSDHVIRANYIHDITHNESLPNDPHIDFFQTWRTARNILFEKNICYSSDTFGSNQIVMIAQGDNDIVENLTFKNNLFIMSDPGYVPMHILGGWQDNTETINNVKVIHNTFVHKSRSSSPADMASCALWLTRIRNLEFKNNILINYAGPLLEYVSLKEGCSNIDIGNNLIYNTNGVTPKSSPYPGDVWLQDPLFVDPDNNDFHLQSSSPAIDAGVDVGLSYNGNAPDIGAYEYEGIAPPPANQPPIANIQATPLQGVAPLEATLDASSSTDPEQDPLTYAWDFDDGNFAEGEVVTHTYIEAGEYTIVLVVSDGSETDTAQVNVTVTEENIISSIPEERLPIGGWQNMEWTDPNNWVIVDVTDNAISNLPLSGDAASALRTLIDDVSIGGDTPTILYFPEGEYLLNSGDDLMIKKSNLMIKGAGPDKTKIIVDSNFGRLYFQGKRYWTRIDITEDSYAGSNIITIQDATDFNIGDMVYIEQDIDYYLAEWGKRSGGGTYMITDVSGNQLTLNLPLFIPIELSRTPQLMRHTPLINVGIQDITIERTPYDNDKSTMKLEWVHNALVKNVTSLNAAQNHIDITCSNKVTIKSNYLSGALDLGSGGNGYGVSMGTSSTEMLVVDNILENLRHSIITQMGSHYNVIAYNYKPSPDKQWDKNKVLQESPDMSIHGHYPHNTLIEGNDFYWSGCADWWGPAGPNIMYFRNRVHGNPSETSWIDYGIYFWNSESDSAIGNYFLDDGFVYKENNVDVYTAYNYYHDAIDWGSMSPDSVLPDSLYYKTKPDFWLDGLAWPPYGADITNTPSNKIPAQVRYEKMTASGNVYYVSTSGDDSNPGTETLPFRTIQMTANIVEPGDIIKVMPGLYEEYVTIRRSGTQYNRMVFEAVGAVSMQGFNIVADYISIKGFEITNIPDGKGEAIYSKGHYNHIENNYIHHTSDTGSGIWIVGHWPEWGDIFNESTYNIVRNNRIEYVRRQGIRTFGSYNLIEGNDISHTLTNEDGSGDADGMHFHGKGHIIRNNYIHDLIKEETTGDPHMDCFQTWRDAYDILFEGNICVLGIPPQDGRSSYQFFMISSDNPDVRNLTFRNNVFVSSSNGYAPICIVSRDERISGITVVNNTFVRDQGRGQYAVRLIDIDDATVKNNIFYDTASSSRSYVSLEGSNIGIDISNNLLYMTTDDPVGGTPYPNDLWFIDPKLKDIANRDFHLSAGSPAIDAGTDVGITHDFDGNPVPQGQAPDIGAYEYKGSTPPSQPTIFNPEEYIEAEDGVVNSPMEIQSDGLASGTYYVYTPRSDQGSVSFTFNIQEEHEYYLEARVLTPSPNQTGHDSFYVGLNGEDVQGNNEHAYHTITSDTYVWDKVSIQGPMGNHLQSDYDPMVWTLTKGEHTFTFYGRETRTRLDQIMLLKYTPPGPNQIPVFDASLTDKTIDEGEKLTFEVKASDPDGDALNYSAANLPEGAEFDTNTHIFTWTPTYEQEGKYNITFTVTDGEGTVSKKITIDVIDVDISPPELGLYATVNGLQEAKGEVPLTAEFKVDITNFKAAVARYEWDFEGNSVYDWHSNKTGDTSFIYKEAGTFTPTVKVIDQDGNETTYTLLVVAEPITRAPVITSFTANPASGTCPLRVELEVKVEDLDTITSYEWDFEGDGRYDSNTDSSKVTKLYTRPGLYPSLVRVTNLGGYMTTETVLIEVVKEIPLPEISFVKAGENYLPNGTTEVNFKLDIITDEDIIKIEIDYDGDKSYDYISTKYEKEVSYIYKEAGTYNVQVKVTVKGSVTNTIGVSIQVEAPDISEPPHIVVTVNGQDPDKETIQGVAPFEVLFKDATQGEVSEYSWDFNGDGKTDASIKEKNASQYSDYRANGITHTYKDSGTYIATLIVTDANGLSSRKDIPVYISALAKGTISITGPQDGQVLKGGIFTLIACLQTQPKAVSEVKLQYRRKGNNTWVDIPAVKDIGYSYVGKLEMSGIANHIDGDQYELRAVRIGLEGGITYSDIITFTIDNLSPSPDIQEDANSKKILISNLTINEITMHTNGRTTKICVPGGAINTTQDILNIYRKELNLIPDSLNNSGLKDAQEYWKFEMESGNNEFNQEITISFSYLDEDNNGIVDGTDLDENDLKVYYYNTSEAKWIEAPDSTIYPKDNYIEVNLNHFTLFGLGGDSGDDDGGGTIGSIGGGGGGGGCFIATAAYGTDMASEVIALKMLRDNHLKKNPLGQAFIRTYYKYSPKGADFIRNKPRLRAVARMLLRPLIEIVELMER